MANKNPLRSLILLATIVGGSAAFAACSSDENPAPTPGTPDASSGGAGGAGTGGKAGGGTGGKAGGGTGGVSTEGGSTGGTSTDGGGSGGVGGTDGSTGTGGATPVTDGGPCKTSSGPPGCSCDRSQTLNYCTDNSGNCIKFDNAAHGIPATLPALQ